jgi:hypothetical protein
MADQKDRLLKLFQDNYDSHFRGANYLFVAHGGGFVGCLALLKDYAATPEYKGVGLFIVLFGSGLLAGVFYYISLAFSRATALNSVMDGNEPDSAWRTLLALVNSISLVIAILILTEAIVALMVRFGRL